MKTKLIGPLIEYPKKDLPILLYCLVNIPWGVETTVFLLNILISVIFRMIGAHRIIRWVLRSMVHDPSAITEMQVNGYAAPLRSKGAMRSLMETARQIVPPNLEQLVLRYPEVTTPTLLLWGKGDSVVPLTVGQRLAQALPDAHLHVLDACGHMPAEELPEESFAVLSLFLDGSGAQA